MSRPLLLLAGTVTLAAVIVIAALFLAPAAPPPEETLEGVPAGPKPRHQVSAASTRRPPPEEDAAKALFEAASTPSAYREVWRRHPSTSWGKRAEEKFRALDEASKAALDRDFEEVRRKAAALPPGEAVAAWTSYAEKAGSDARARAEAAALEVENRNRSAYNDAVAKARELAGRRSYAEGAALFEALAKGATTEVASRAAESAAQLRKAAEEDAAADIGAKREAARKLAREETAPKALAALRARRYADALRELADAPLLEADLALERSIVERAKAFWDGFLKAAKGRAGQDVSLLLAGGKRLAGRLEALREDRAALMTVDGLVEIPLDQVALDQVAAWAFGAAPDGTIYLNAAMFFFAEGRDDLASTYLATAAGKGAETAEVERTWREGFLRAASKPKDPPPAKKKK